MNNVKKSMLGHNFILTSNANTGGGVQGGVFQKHIDSETFLNFCMLSDLALHSRDKNKNNMKMRKVKEIKRRPKQMIFSLLLKEKKGCVTVMLNLVGINSICPGASRKFS